MSLCRASSRWLLRPCRVTSSYSSTSRATNSILSCRTYSSSLRLSIPPQPLKNQTRSHTRAANGRKTQSGRRAFSSTAVSFHEHLTPPKPGEELHVTFVDKEGGEHTFEVANGDNLLDIALENDVDMEGACGGSCACSTCHVIVEDDAMYEKMDEPDDDENDMLDLAFGLTETSRLGCQVKMRPDLDGLKVKLPSMTRNMQASDFSKK